MPETLTTDRVTLEVFCEGSIIDDVGYRRLFQLEIAKALGGEVVDGLLVRADALPSYVGQIDLRIVHAPHMPLFGCRVLTHHVRVTAPRAILDEYGVDLVTRLRTCAGKVEVVATEVF